MTFDWQLAENMRCSREEKIEIVSLIDILVRMSEKARAKGLLALDGDIDGYEHPLLKLGMRLVVDGTDPEIIKSILRARILSENKRGRDLLEQIIIYDAVSSIQWGDNPRILETKCFSFLGEDADELQAKYASEARSSFEGESVENYINADGTVTEFFAEMRKLLSLDDRSVQKTLREVDASELTVVLAGCDSDVRKKIFKNVSRRAAMLLVSETRRFDPQPDAVEQHIARLFEIVAKLEEAGEITFDG